MFHRKTLTALVLASLVPACAPLRMAVPGEVGAQTEEIAITDRSSVRGALVDESFTMGAFQVVDVDRDWTSSSSFSTMGFTAEDSTTSYRYQLRGAATEVAGECAVQGDEQSLEIGAGMNLSQQASRLGCRCGEASFFMQAPPRSGYRGTVTAPDYSFRIGAIYATEQGASMRIPTGYRVDGDRFLAAVEVVNKGRVWFDPALAPEARDDLACLFAGLLLYMPPEDRP